MYSWEGIHKFLVGIYITRFVAIVHQWNLKTSKPSVYIYLLKVIGMNGGRIYEIAVIEEKNHNVTKCLNVN